MFCGHILFVQIKWLNVVIEAGVCRSMTTLWRAPFSSPRVRWKHNRYQPTGSALRTWARDHSIHVCLCGCFGSPCRCPPVCRGISCLCIDVSRLLIWAVNFSNPRIEPQEHVPLYRSAPVILFSFLPKLPQGEGIRFRAQHTHTHDSSRKPKNCSKQ